MKPVLKLAVWRACLAAVLLAGCNPEEVPEPPTSTETPTEEQMVSLPDVTGLPYREARAELKELNLEVRRAEAESERTVDTVLEQDPVPETRMDAGALVTLTVSVAEVSAAPTEPVDPSASWSDIYERTGSGVVRLKTAMCGEDVGTGSGFLIAPDLVATNAHVVPDGVEMTIDSGDEIRRGQVIGSDEALDIALVRAEEPFSGHVFAAAAASAEVGTEVAALGYPLGQPLSIVRGTVSGLDRAVDDLNGVLQTDAAINPGNSGGPLLNDDGEVVGVIVAVGLRPESADGQRVTVRAEGIAYAIPSGMAFPALNGWRASPEPQEPMACEGLEPDMVLTVTAVVDHSEADALVDTFETYATGINTADYESAYAQMTPDRQEQIPYERFVNEQRSSFVWDVVITAIQELSDHELAVDVEFWTQQASEYGPEGQTCSEWFLTYRMERQDETWKIGGANINVDGSPFPCDAES